MDTLDVRGLSDNKIEFLQRLIELMRQEHQKPVSSPVDATAAIRLHCWHLGVKGKISREAIYDYLDA